MKTKNIYILLAVATMIASCSQDVIEDSVFNGDEVYATLPELDYGNITRSALTYDYKEKKMHFSWDANDNIGVFAINADAGRRQQMQFKLFDGAGSLAGSFACPTRMCRLLLKRTSTILLSDHIVRKTTMQNLT